MSGIQDLYLVFTGVDDYLINLNYFSFGKDSPTLLGDLNGDGSVDGLDLALMKMHLLGSGNDIPVDIGDFNNDKDINALDFAILKQILLEK